MITINWLLIIKMFNNQLNIDTVIKPICICLVNKNRSVIRTVRSLIIINTLSIDSIELEVTFLKKILFFGTGDWTRDLMLSRQALKPWAKSPAQKSLVDGKKKVARFCWLIFKVSFYCIKVLHFTERLFNCEVTVNQDHLNIYWPEELHKANIKAI